MFLHEVSVILLVAEPDICTVLPYGAVPEGLGPGLAEVLLGESQYL